MLRDLWDRLLGPPLPKYTLEEIAVHNSEGNEVWLVAHGKIFNAKPILEEGHPGGDQSILRRARACADATQDYDFHSKSARRKWEQHIVGVVTRKKK